MKSGQSITRFPHVRCGGLRAIAIAAAAYGVLLSGCGGSSSSGGGVTQNQPLGQAASSVYVGGITSVLQFPAGANGSVSPAATLNVSNTEGVDGIAIDSSGDLYVGDLNATSVSFEVRVYAPGAGTNAAPVRTIASNYNFVDPVAMVIDSSGNLYIGGDSQSIVVYPSTANGSSAPARTIYGSLTQLNSDINGMAIDAAGNLYATVYTLTGSAILVFAPGASGNVAPVRTITSSNLFYGIAVDSSGNIYAVNDPNSSSDSWSIQEFSSTASGAATPTKTITIAGSNPASGRGLSIDGAGNLYVVGQALVGSGVSQAYQYSLLEFGPSATGTASPTAAFSSTSWTYASGAVAVK